jgi:hypothetical protein
VAKQEADHRYCLRALDSRSPIRQPGSGIMDVHGGLFGVSMRRRDGWLVCTPWLRICQPCMDSTNGRVATLQTHGAGRGAASRRARRRAG